MEGTTGSQVGQAQTAGGMTVNIKSLLVLVAISLLFAVGCASTQQQSAVRTMEVPSTLHKEVQVKVMVNPEEIPEGDIPEDLLWEKAEKEGLGKAINSWLRQRLLVKTSSAQVTQSSFLERKGQFSPSQDEITNVYAQRFRISVDFTGATETSGKITSFLDGRDMGGENSYCTIQLADQAPGDQGAYFLVTRPEKVQNKRLMRVIGSGKIYNTVDSTAQALLMETNREIHVGDAVFLLVGSVKPVSSAPAEAPEATEAGEVNEVVVEPSMEPEPVEEPAEPK